MCVLLQLEATMARLAAHLTQLQELTLIFNNPGQQLETRHLASLAALPALSSLTLQGNFHPESCNFSAALGPCSGLVKLVVLPSEASSGLTDRHVASLAGLRGLQALEFPGHARAFTGASLSALAAALPLLSRLVISSNKPGAVDYTLALPALAGLRALTRRWAGPVMCVGGWTWQACMYVCMYVWVFGMHCFRGALGGWCYPSAASFACCVCLLQRTKRRARQSGTDVALLAFALSVVTACLQDPQQQQQQAPDAGAGCP
jgi:hypothetical protein